MARDAGGGAAEGRVPVVFQMPIVVTEEHSAAAGRHVHNVAYVEWVQSVAMAHWRTVATPEMHEAVVWYVRRHEIDYLKECWAGDRLTATTYVGECHGAAMVRFVELTRADGSVACRARTTWVAISTRSGRPTRITEAMRAPLFEDNGGDAGP
jgi:acyl-CoA thioester hydrolase